MHSGIRYPVLSDIDNGYALSVGLAISVGDEVEEAMRKGGRDLPEYQGNEAWILAIPATFVLCWDGRVAARFIDPDYRHRMAVNDLLVGLAPGGFLGIVRLALRCCFPTHPWNDIQTEGLERAPRLFLAEFP